MATLVRLDRRQRRRAVAPEGAGAPRADRAGGATAGASWSPISTAVIHWFELAPTAPYLARAKAGRVASAMRRIVAGDLLLVFTDAAS